MTATNWNAHEFKHCGDPQFPNTCYCGCFRNSSNHDDPRLAELIAAADTLLRLCDRSSADFMSTTNGCRAVAILRAALAAYREVKP